MVFYHGGGWVIGDLDTHEPYCAEAARQLDMPVIAVDYRLAPEHPFPAAPIDCEAAARWVADNIPCTGLVLSGESAGGNLTIVTALTLRDTPASKPVIAIHPIRSEEHTSELQSLIRISYSVFCLKQHKIHVTQYTNTSNTYT